MRIRNLIAVLILGISAHAQTAPVVSAAPTPTTPAVTTTAALSVVVSVAGSPTPTGSVVLTAGSFTSAATTLSGGSATISIPAGLATGTVTVAYTPDTAGAKLYSASSSTLSVAIAAAATTTPAGMVPSAGFSGSISNFQMIVGVQGLISQAWATITINGTPFLCTYQQSTTAGMYSLDCITPVPTSTPPIVSSN